MYPVRWPACCDVTALELSGNRALAVLIAVLLLTLPGLAAHADSTLDLFAVQTQTPFLRVDFGESGTDSLPETGFFAFESSGSGLKTEMVPTSQGTVAVSVNGQNSFFLSGPISDSGSMTFAEMYSDFVFANDGGPINFAVDGLLPDREYELTVYAYQSASFQVETGVVPAGDTIGPSGSILWNGSVPPTTNDQYAFTGIYTVGSSGILSFDTPFISATHSLDLIRISGFEVGLVPIPPLTPEPSSIALFACVFAMMGGGLYYRRRRTVAA